MSRKFKTQLAEKLRELGYHVNDTPYSLTAYMHGNYAFSLSRVTGRCRVNGFKSNLSDEVLMIIEKYGDY